MTDYNIQTIAVEADKTDVICDIDGTLMNVEDRLALAIKNKRPEDRKMNWDIFLDPKVMEAEDRPNWDVVFLIKKLISTGSTIIFTSARNERHRDVSIKQIVHGCNISMAVTRYSNKGNRLYLRKDGDFRTDDITKKEIFEKEKTWNKISNTGKTIKDKWQKLSEEETNIIKDIQGK